MSLPGCEIDRGGCLFSFVFPPSVCLACIGEDAAGGMGVRLRGFSGTLASGTRDEKRDGGSLAEAFREGLSEGCKVYRKRAKSLPCRAEDDATTKYPGYKDGEKGVVLSAWC